MTFTDAHVHFWDPAVFSYPWLARHPEVARRHTPAELDAELPGAAPARMIFIQAECAEDEALNEVAWVEGMAAADPRIAALVAYCRMEDSRACRERLAELRRHPLVRGVRHLIQGQPNPAFCTQPGFVAGVHQCGAAGLLFELCCVADQLPGVIELVRACPDTRFVLDHAGKPDIRGGRFDAWRAQIDALAALPNIACKLSALVTQARHDAWQIADLRPYWNHLVAAFGAARLLFGSDWPVVKLASTYRRWLGAAIELAEPLSPAGRAAIFHGNAGRIYGYS
ncbi:MAG TPA: amidohydrolase family protein [Opitutus sp.]|nr:amidohydrolase family protein [Opitutus sp.]